MDPNVQVALVSVLATFVTTIGVIAVAIINNRKERGGAASAGVEAGLDERDILGRMLTLISENERKEKQIVELTQDKKAQAKLIRELRGELRDLRDDPQNGELA